MAFVDSGGFTDGEDWFFVFVRDREVVLKDGFKVGKEVVEVTVAKCSL